MINRFGVYYAFLCDSEDINWMNCISRTQAAGLGVTELSAVQFRNKPKFLLNEIAEYIRYLDLGLSFATGLSPATDVSSEEEKVRRCGIELLKRDIELCSQMGGTKIGGIIYGVHKNLPQGAAFIREELFDRAAGSLREVAKTADEYGVTLAAEVVNRFESPILNTAEEGVRFVKAIDNPSVGLHLDTFHMNIEEDDLPAAIYQTGKYLKHIHFCENNRKLPGRGHIDWEGVVKALNDTGYDDTIVIESLPFPYGNAADRLNIWRNLLDKDADTDLVAAAVFLKKLFKKAG